MEDHGIYHGDLYIQQFLEDAGNDPNSLIDWADGLSTPSEDQWITDMLTDANADDTTMDYWYNHLLDDEVQGEKRKSDDHGAFPPKKIIGSGPNNKVCVNYYIKYWRKYRLHINTIISISTRQSEMANTSPCHIPVLGNVPPPHFFS